MSTKAIPALIDALDDDSPHVRFDALVAIEKAAGLAIGELSAALLLRIDDRVTVRRRVRAWWRIVREDTHFHDD